MVYKCTYISYYISIWSSFLPYNRMSPQSIQYNWLEKQIRLQEKESKNQYHVIISNKFLQVKLCNLGG